MATPAAPVCATYEFDLGAMLHRSRWLYERDFGAERMVYAPDWHGMPVMLSAPAQRLLDRFAGGISAGAAIAAETSEFENAIPRVDAHGERSLRARLRPGATGRRSVRAQGLSTLQKGNERLVAH